MHRYPVDVVENSGFIYGVDSVTNVCDERKSIISEGVYYNYSNLSN